jgi:hypothetical protein
MKGIGESSIFEYVKCSQAEYEIAILPEMPRHRYIDTGSVTARPEQILYPAHRLGLCASSTCLLSTTMDLQGMRRTIPTAHDRIVRCARPSRPDCAFDRDGGLLCGSDGMIVRTK